jgi:hypothetical protein
MGNFIGPRPLVCTEGRKLFGFRLALGPHAARQVLRASNAVKASTNLFKVVPRLFLIVTGGIINHNSFCFIISYSFSLIMIFF